MDKQEIPEKQVLVDSCNGKVVVVQNTNICSPIEIGLSTSTVGYSRKERPYKIPDGGWGWMVVSASVVISAVADGVTFSFGLLYIEFLKEFRLSKASTSWIGSLFLAVPLLTGPIMSALVDRYGCRLMTIIGGIISGTGFVISSYVRTIGIMYLTFGVMTGLGLGLCYVTAIVAIAFWFEKKRSLAIGLGSCGTGIGTFIYAPLTQYLITEYGWRGTTLFLAGGFFNICVCGALMRDPDWVIQQNRNNSIDKLSKSSSSVSRRSDLTDANIDELRKLLESGKSAEYILQTLATTIDMRNKNNSSSCYSSVINLPTYIKQNEKVPIEVLQQLASNKHLYKIILENYPSMLSCRSMSDKDLNKLVTDSSSPQVRVPVTVSMKLKKTDIVREKDPIFDESTLHDSLLQTDVKVLQDPLPTIRRVDSLPWLRRQFSGHTNNYLRNVRFKRESVVHRGAMLNIHKYRLRASSCPNIYRNSMITLNREDSEKWYYDYLQLFKNMADFSLLRELHFFLLFLSTIVLFAWVIIPYFYLATHLTENGYTESDASLVLSTIGGANTFGMIVLGWAGDHKWMNVTKTYAVCLVLCGVSVISMMIFTNIYSLVVISAGFFGLFFASNFSFTPGILVELVPLERFTISYGLILLSQGIGHLVGPPLGGLLFDITKGWEHSFWQAGFWIIFSGILIGIIPYTKNRKWMGHGPVEKDLASEKGSII